MSAGYQNYRGMSRKATRTRYSLDVNIEVYAFEEAHIDAAATLLAEQVRSARSATPELPQRFEEPAEARKPFDFVWKLPMSGGVVATQGGREGKTVGFMLGLAFPDDVSHYASAPLSAVSRRVTARSEVLREMYAGLAEEWVRAGCIGHYPSVPASEPELIEAWYSLGFGQDNVAAVRDTSAPEAAAPNGIEIRRAGPDDQEPIEDLFEELSRHLAGPATFAATRPESWIERLNLEVALAKDGHNVYWLALRNGKAIGVQHMEPTATGRPYLPEECIQLQHAVTVTDVRGLEHP